MNNLETISKSLFPEKFSSNKHEEAILSLHSVDNTQILGERIYELGAIVYFANQVYRSLGKQFSDIKLFEAGNCPKGDLSSGLYTSNIAYFFSNHPKIMHYTGYDQNNTDKIIDKYEFFTSKAKKAAKPKGQVNKQFLKNQAQNYEEFENKIRSAENPIIFSNYVLGCPNLGESRFWTLQGIHMHMILTGDLQSQWLEKHHPKEYTIENDSSQGRIDTFESVRLLFLKKNNFIPVQRQISKISSDVFETPLDAKYHLFDENRAMIYYQI